jgi:asparagine synthase (glutamine-hydrolysing)
MCGIAGILTHKAISEHLNQAIRAMQATLNHRGPDDQGRFISASGQAGLAHTRLSILDLSPAGHQPLSTPDGRYWISFNGEIYNFQSLRSQLKAQGVTFQSHSDTEVLLRLYERDGSACLHHLRGMFAFAIWDDWEKTAFLARDPLGIKPLYYWQSGSTFVFASELRALLASGLPQKQLSPPGLYGYLTTGSVPEPYTLIDQIYLLKAGHWLQWQAGTIQQQSYWQIDFSPQAIAPTDAVAKTRSALLDSVQHHFVSDVPVGVFLSGGIDSTALVALARQTQLGQLHTYSIGFEETQWNEADLAKRVADHFGTVHTEHTVTASVGRALLPQFLSAVDQPSIDGFNTFCVSKIARDAGMKVVLSGLGGDELFGGYKSFQTVAQMARWGQKYKSLQAISQPLGWSLERWSHSSKLRRLGDFLQAEPSVSAAYQRFRGVFSHREACQILRDYWPDLKALGPRATAPFSQSFASTADEISWLELSRYMRNQLLRDSDVMSMYCGLELRVPLVDRQLLESIATIPSSLRLQLGKKLLTQAVPEIPSWIIDQPKRGFYFPYEQWMQNEWQDYLLTAPMPRQIPLSPWYRRWSLVVLHHWWQQINA